MEDPTVRERLVRAGVDLLAERGVAALSLREIARRAGVSHGAPRRWFPTHRELMSAVAREGFAALGARVHAALSDPDDPLLAVARCYLGFARENPGMFELMFRHDLLRSDHLGLRESSLPLFEVLVGLLTPDTPQPRLAAGALWANLHGICQLWIWGSLPLATGTGDVDPLLRAALDAHRRPR